VWRRKHDNMFSRFDTIPACDGRTDVKPIAITCFSIADARKNKVARFYGSQCIKFDYYGC